METLLPFAHQLADAAGAVIRPYFGTTLDVEQKSDDSPVSRADREAEAAIRALIAQHYPEHAILGEEFKNTGDWPLATGDYLWVIDPIDGTRAFLAGGHEWGTLITLCENGVPVLGILDQPVTGERWVGVREKEAIYRAPLGEAIAGTRACTTLTDAAISTTSARYFTPPQAGAFVQLADQCGTVIENGDCYAYGLLALGQRDLVVDAGLKPYDILALVPIIEGAGGVITGWDGAPVTLTNYANVVAAGNVDLHKVALAILGKAR